MQRERARIIAWNKRGVGQPIGDDEGKGMMRRKYQEAVANYVAEKPETLRQMVWKKNLGEWDEENQVYKPVDARGTVPGTTLFASDEDEAAGTPSASGIAMGWPVLRAGDIRPMAADDGTGGTTPADALTEADLTEENLTVVFFPTLPMFAAHNDILYMDDQNTSRDLDKRNRQRYAEKYDPEYLRIEDAFGRKTVFEETTFRGQTTRIIDWSSTEKGVCYTDNPNLVPSVWKLRNFTKYTKPNPAKGTPGGWSGWRR